MSLMHAQDMILMYISMTSTTENGVITAGYLLFPQPQGKSFLYLD